MAKEIPGAALNTGLDRKEGERQTQFDPITPTVTKASVG
jgi:hypothetical protein